MTRPTNIIKVIQGYGIQKIEISLNIFHLQELSNLLADLERAEDMEQLEEPLSRAKSFLRNLTQGTPSKQEAFDDLFPAFIEEVEDMREEKSTIRG